MPKARPAPRAFDPRSAAPTLAYRGPGALDGIPARDLSGADLARIAWVRRGAERDGSPIDVTADEVAAVLADLVASGLYAAEPAAPPATEVPEP